MINGENYNYIVFGRDERTWEKSRELCKRFADDSQFPISTTLAADYALSPNEPSNDAQSESNGIDMKMFILGLIVNNDAPYLPLAKSNDGEESSWLKTETSKTIFEFTEMIRF